MFFDPGLLNVEAPTSDGWRDLAECRDHPLDLFFPVRGESLAPARAICARCPVQIECLGDALERSGVDDGGVRGGLSLRQRRALRVMRRRRR